MTHTTIRKEKGSTEDAEQISVNSVKGVFSELSVAMEEK